MYKIEGPVYPVSPHPLWEILGTYLHPYFLAQSALLIFVYSF